MKAKAKPRRRRKPAPPYVPPVRCAHCLNLGPPDYVCRVYRKSESQNRLRANFGSARFAYKDQKVWWTAALKQRVAAKVVPVATGRRIVRITREMAGLERPRDYGNLVGGLKPILDAMTKAGIIVDDSERWLIDIYEQARGEDTCVKLEIWEAA